MNNIELLVNIAKIKNQIKTNKKIADLLGISCPSLCNAVKGKTKLRHENFDKLAALCSLTDAEYAQFMLEYYSKNSKFEKELDLTHCFQVGDMVYIPHKV